MPSFRLYIALLALGYLTAGCGKGLNARLSGQQDLAGGNFEQNEQSGGFQLGSSANNAFVYDNNNLQLAPSGITAKTGDYLSRYFSAPTTVAWQAFGWVPARPYGKNLPNAGHSETAYHAGNANMTGNQLLMHFDETTADHSFADSSPTKAIGGCTGAVCPTVGTAGKLGNAVTFTKTQAVTIPASTGLKILPQSTGLTIEAWVYLNTAPAASQIIVANNTAGTTPCGFNLYFASATSIRSADGCGNGVTFTYTFKVHQWYHIAVIWTPAPNRAETLYVNGAAVTHTALATNWVSNNKWTHFVVGATTASNGFGGAIDELAVFSRPLSADEIKDHYYRGAMQVSFQLRSCSSTSCGHDFVGPDGTPATSFSERLYEGADLPAFSLVGVIPNNPYLQYRAAFRTDTTVSPIIHDVGALGILQ